MKIAIMTSDYYFINIRETGVCSGRFGAGLQSTDSSDSESHQLWHDSHALPMNCLFANKLLQSWFSQIVHMLILWVAFPFLVLCCSVQWGPVLTVSSYYSVARHSPALFHPLPSLFSTITPIPCYYPHCKDNSTEWPMTQREPKLTRADN